MQDQAFMSAEPPWVRTSLRRAGGYFYVDGSGAEVGRRRLTAFEPRIFRINTNAGTCEHDTQISRIGREAS